MAPRADSGDFFWTLVSDGFARDTWVGVNCSAVLCDHLVSWPSYDREDQRHVPLMGELMPVLDPSELLEVAMSVAREAADLARTQRVCGVSELGTKSTHTDLVTAADRAVERLIGERLLALRPGDDIFGEEFGAGTPTNGTDRVGGPDARVRWVIDPIDGTVNYVYGIPHYAVSIAAEVDGVVMAGVVHNVGTGEEWTAMRGQGAWRADVRLVGSSVTSLDKALIATGFGYAAARRAHQAAVVAQLLPQVRDIRRFGAASLDLCAAAEGRVDGYFEKGLGAWDHAAGGLVAREAGLMVTGLRGAPAGPDLVLAAPVGLYRHLHDLLVSLDADGGP
jgi:myo-inositol-1(or 4)-monophosphatase